MKVLISGETFDLDIEEVHESNKKTGSRGGILFRTETNRKFFVPYNRFSFVVRTQRESLLEGLKTELTKAKHPNIKSFMRWLETQPLDLLQNMLNRCNSNS